MTARSRHDSGGFSLLELCVVLTLAAILAAYSLPKLSLRDFQDVRVRDELLAVTRQAQQLSMNLEQASVELVLTSSSYGVRVDGSYIPDALGQLYPKSLPTGFSLSPAPLTLGFSRLGALNLSALSPIKVLGGGSGAQFCIETSGYAHVC